MKCQKLSFWLFTAVDLKVVYIVEVVFVCFFWGGGTNWNLEVFLTLFFVFSSQKEKTTFSSSDEEN